MTNFNERTNTLLYKNIISHTLFLKGWCWLCVRDELGDWDRLLYWTQVLLTIAAVLPHLGWGCSTVGHWGPKALCLPLVLTWASCLPLSQAVCALVILLFNVHLLPLFFRLFTQVRLLIDGSVEGQSITLCPITKYLKTIYLLSCFIVESVLLFVYGESMWWNGYHSGLNKRVRIPVSLLFSLLD